MTSTTSLRRTPLYDTYKALGGKLVPFAGWEMPVQYAGGILAEHHEVFGFAVGGGGAENALPDRDAGKPAGLSWAEAAALPAAAIWRQLA